MHCFKGNEWILDVGCGDGKVTTRLALNVAARAVKGIDPSHMRVDLAKNSFAKKDFFNVPFEI